MLFIILILAAYANAPSTVEALHDTVDAKCSNYGPRDECGFQGITQMQCEQQGCCWLPADYANAPHVDLPWCFTPNALSSTYDLQPSNAADFAFTGRLELATSTQSELGPDIQTLSVALNTVSESIVQLHITDANKQRWEVPRNLFKTDTAVNKTNQEPNFSINYESTPFSLTVHRNSDGKEILNTKNHRLVFKDQYIELTTWLDTEAKIYGAGERTSNTLHLERNGLPLALWNRDVPPTAVMQNLYGSHPFVLALASDGSAWGYLMMNSNAQDIVPSADRLSWRLTGGVVDLYIMLGPTPLDVMNQVTQIIGRPAMMPRWSLGWHQCKYGYKSVWEVEDVVAQYKANAIPLDAIWTDIDYMDGWRDFTFDKVNFPVPEMQRFVNQLHENKQRWVPIVDPGIKVDPGYDAYDQGLQHNAFVRNVFNTEPYLGWVWPGASHYPDFFQQHVGDYFTRQLIGLHTMVPWDGIWIDMNEVSNFCSGDACRLRLGALNNKDKSQLTSAQKVAAQRKLLLSRHQFYKNGDDSIASSSSRQKTIEDDPPWVCQLDCPDITSSLNATQKAFLNPPYHITNGLSYKNSLSSRLMSVLATHLDANIAYNTHNLYSLAQAKSVYTSVASITNKRPFLLTRSSFSGSGAYTAHWTGDNAATWQDMRWSIIGVLNGGLFGFPLTGADICGFQGITTEELCARWVALGAFFPFARSHSDLNGGYQEPYRWPLVAEVARKALNLRYSLLPYLYSTLAIAHSSGAPIARPLWMNYPSQQTFIQ